MKRIMPEQQGSVDGLCGIYSLLNFIKDEDCFDLGGEKAANAFWYLLEAMEAEGVMTPYRLWYGLETFQLKRVFDKVSSDFQLPFSSHRISDVLSMLSVSTFKEAMPRILESGGAAVVGLNESNHWFLIHGQEAGYLLVRDSGHLNRSRMARSDVSRISSDGLVLLRNQSALAQRLAG